MIVKRSGKRVTRICGHFFMPGNNNVPDHLKDRLLNDRQFKHELQNGTMAIVGAKANVTQAEVKVEASGPEPGPDMPYKDMIGVVKNTFDRATLEHFAKIDSRATVQKAITEQLEAIAPPPPKEEEPETESDEDEV